jgi:hypothetical protein
LNIQAFSNAGASSTSLGAIAEQPNQNSPGRLGFKKG